MIRRFLCLLLVALMLANPGLGSAHAHHRTDFAEPEGHRVRPHFHVGGHVHHDGAHNHPPADHSHPDHSDSVPNSNKRDTTLPPAFSLPVEHDSDAVYFGESVTIVRNGNSVKIFSEKDVAASAISQVAIQNDGLRQIRPLRGQPPLVIAAPCPIYLRTLSLRI